MIVVDDPDDPRVAPFRLNERGLANRVQRRDDTGDGLFMAEGDLVVERALDAGCTPVIALVDASRPPAVVERLTDRATVYAGGERLRAAVTKLGMPYSVVALFERPARTTVANLATTTDRLVLAEAVDNPLNIGSIARNALALGWQGLVIDGTSVDPLARRALRVSMGQALSLPHARTTDLLGDIAALRRDEWQVVALTPSADAVPLDEISPAPKVALLLGSERAGLSEGAMQAADLRARIPMHAGVDSLNVANASAVACWQLRRQG